MNPPRKEGVHQCYGLPKYCIGVAERALEVEEMRTRANVVGIVGAGGVGKTTIAMQVFNSISREFEYTCFLNNVKDIPSHHRPHFFFRPQFYRNGTKLGVNQLAWTDLKGKKTLMVLDDVDSEAQLEAFPKVDHFGTGSLFIITTSNQGIFRMYPHCEVYEVVLLTDEEATRLFCHHAFGKEGPPNNLLGTNDHLIENIKTVVKECRGHPLTLEILGSYFQGSDSEVSFWAKTIEALQKAQDVDANGQVFAALQVSLETLSLEERKMFIEAGTYFLGKPVERALVAWSTTYKSSATAWKNLLGRSMVKEDEDGQVWVHGQMCDLAKNLGEVKMVSGDDREAEEIVNLLHANAVLTETSILRLSRPFSWPSRVRLHLSRGMRSRNIPRRLDGDEKALQLSSLEKMENLTCLELLSVPHKGTSKHFPTKLSLLKWSVSHERKSEFPISLQEMTNLAILELEGWTISKDFPTALGNLINLGILSLSWLEGLDHLPESFGNLSCLKRFDLTRVSLSNLPRSFGNLSALEHLNLSQLQILELPKSFGDLSSLVELDISNCKKLASLPDSFGDLSSLVELKLFCCLELASLPESFGSLPLLEELLIHNCQGLTDLGNSFGNLSTLRDLSLCAALSLERLPTTFGDLSSLEDFSLYNCTKLKRLPDNFGQLRALKRLTIYSADQLEELSDSFGNLSSLTYLHLHECPKLERLPLSFGLLGTLEELSLHRCRRLQILPDDFHRLLALKKLTISYTHRLEEVLDNVLLLKSLEHLDITCEDLERLPERLGELASLQTLRVTCSSLEMLPDSIAALKKVELLFCRRLKTLPDSLGKPFSPQVAAPQGDEATELTGLVEGQASQTVYTEGMLLRVKGCELLDASVLERLGWEEKGDDWYSRKRSQI